MDLLAGYGSGSDNEGDADSSPPRVVTAAASKPQQDGSNRIAARLFGSLPAPKDAPGGYKAPSSLPAGFFDPIPAAEAAGDEGGPPADAPPGFFDPMPGPLSSLTAAKPQSTGSATAEPPAAASTQATPLFSKLPAANKRKVLLRPQVDLQLLAQQSDSDDEDAPAAKKIKQQAAAAAAAKSSILSFLPAPKNTGTGKRMDLGGAGAGLGAGSRIGLGQHNQQQQQQQQQHEDAAAVAGHAGLASTAPAAGNEAYRLRPAAVAAGAVAGGADEQQYYSANYQQQYGDYSAAAAASAGTGYGSHHHQHQQQQHYQQQQLLLPEEAFLQEALQAEAAKAARRAAGGGTSQLVLPDIHFKEVKADEVKYVDPAQREAAQGMRSALGTDYAAQLRSQAAPHVGSTLARKKHQIGTLYANAKLRELEVLENRASGMKSKAETAGKYGW